jgi:hypothetical protein
VFPAKNQLSRQKCSRKESLFPVGVCAHNSKVISAKHRNLAMMRLGGAVLSLMKKVRSPEF